MEVEKQSIWEVLRDRRMLICVGLGLASGLPLYLLLQLVPFWLRLEGVSLTVIGLVSLAQVPYTLKFLWSPLLERYQVTTLGRRRGWMLLTQGSLILCIAALGWLRPTSDIYLLFALTLAIGVFSATQDIVIDAFRREILETDGELALGNTIHVQAYRVSGFIPGSLGFILAGQYSSELNFAVMAAFMSLGLILTLLLREPQTGVAPPTNLRTAVTLPFVEFFQRRGIGAALLMLAFMALYKLGDNMATTLASPFYVDLKFDPVVIGVVVKNAAFWPAIVGAFLGSMVIFRIGINRALWIFGFLQWITIFGFVWLAAAATPEIWMLSIVIGAEYLGVGMGTAAYVAFIARETSRVAVATQLALFTALASTPRLVTGAVSGIIVDSMGWVDFFWLSAGLAIPGMLLLIWVAPWNGQQAPSVS